MDDCVTMVTVSFKHVRGDVTEALERLCSFRQSLDAASISRSHLIHRFAHRGLQARRKFTKYLYNNKTSSHEATSDARSQQKICTSRTSGKKKVHKVSLQ